MTVVLPPPLAKTKNATILSERGALEFVARRHDHKSRSGFDALMLPRNKGFESPMPARPAGAAEESPKARYKRCWMRLSRAFFLTWSASCEEQGRAVKISANHSLLSRPASYTVG